MILTFSGPSTIGKDSNWIASSVDLGFKKIVPFTTRLMRESETEGDDYHFLSVEEFQRMIRLNEFIEWDYFNGSYYGTSAKIADCKISENFVFHELARKAIRIKRKLPHAVAVMLLPTNRSTIEKRLQERGYEGDDYVFRFHHFLEELEHAPLFDHVVPDAESLSKYESTEIIKNIMSGYSVSNPQVNN